MQTARQCSSAAHLEAPTLQYMHLWQRALEQGDGGQLPPAHRCPSDFGQVARQHVRALIMTLKPLHVLHTFVSKPLLRTSIQMDAARR